MRIMMVINNKGNKLANKTAGDERKRELWK
jgi:hypothetical protein